MKAPARATKKPSRSKSRVRPQFVFIHRAQKEVRKQQWTCGVKTDLGLKCLVALKIVHVYIVFWTSPSGLSGWDEKSRLSDQSAQFSPTTCAQAGELGGLPAVKKQQNKSHHSGGDQCCCHTCEKENAKQNCCVKSWTHKVDFIKCIKVFFSYLISCFSYELSLWFHYGDDNPKVPLVAPMINALNFPKFCFW